MFWSNSVQKKRTQRTTHSVRKWFIAIPKGIKDEEKRKWETCVSTDRKTNSKQIFLFSLPTVHVNACKCKQQCNSDITWEKKKRYSIEEGRPQDEKQTWMTSVIIFMLEANETFLLQKYTVRSTAQLGEREPGHLGKKVSQKNYDWNKSDFMLAR